MSTSNLTTFYFIHRRQLLGLDSRQCYYPAKKNIWKQRYNYFLYKKNVQLIFIYIMNVWMATLLIF